MGFLHGLIVYVLVPYAVTTLSLFAVAEFLPPSLARASQLAGFFARALAYIFGLIVCATYGTITSIGLNLVGMSGLSQWTTAKAFKWVMWPLVQVWFDVEDQSNASATRPAVFLGNHQTEMDILFLGHIWPKYTSVTAKSNLKWYPFLGQFMYFSNTVFIDRADRTSAKAAFSNAAKHMQDKRQSVFIFPEGTRSYSSKPDLLPFKKGAFHLAIEAQVPIVPMVCGNYSHVLNLKEMKFVSGRIPVRILPAISTKGLTAADVPSLVEKVRNQMLATIKELDVSRRLQLNGSQKSNGVAPALRENARVAMAS